MSDDDSRKSLDDLDERLRDAQEREAVGKPGRGPALKAEQSGFGIAMRIASEMVAALIVGLGIGYLLDLWLGTKPWLMVLFFFLGAGAGVMNVYRAASGLGMKPGYGDVGEKDEKD